jgi:hypothetical protein
VTRAAPSHVIVESPIGRDEIRAQLASCRALNLPQLRAHPTWPFGKITIVANGPSALEIPRHVLSRPETIAINGAIRVFTGAGVAPKYWMSIDPRACVADFLRNAPASTTYCPATHCHPSVFAELSGHRVRPWNCRHPDTDDMLGPDALLAPISSTIAALRVARVLLGFRRVDVWGWDGCMLGGAHHAIPQEHAMDRTTAHLDGNRYETSYGWLAEIDQARRLLGEAGDTKLTVHGPGLVGAILAYHGLAERA